MSERTIVLMYGGDHGARDRLTALFRSFSLEVVNAGEADGEDVSGDHPRADEVVRLDLALADPAIVLLMPEDAASIRRRDGAGESQITSQDVHRNCISCAGIVKARGSDRVVMVEVGVTSDRSEAVGVPTFRWYDDPESLRGLVELLRGAGVRSVGGKDPLRGTDGCDRTWPTSTDMRSEIAHSAAPQARDGGQSGKEATSVQVADVLVASRLCRLDSSLGIDVLGQLSKYPDMAFDRILLSLDPPHRV